MNTANNLSLVVTTRCYVKPSHQLFAQDGSRELQHNNGFALPLNSLGMESQPDCHQPQTSASPFEVLKDPTTTISSHLRSHRVARLPWHSHGCLPPTPKTPLQLLIPTVLPIAPSHCLSSSPLHTKRRARIQPRTPSRAREAPQDPPTSRPSSRAPVSKASPRTLRT